MNGSNGKEHTLLHKLGKSRLAALLILVADFILIHAAYFGALFLRFDCVFSQIPQDYLFSYRNFITLYTIGSIAVFALLRMYSAVWSYVSYAELLRAVFGSVIMSAAHWVLITVICQRMPLSYHIFGGFFQLVFVIAVRFSYRLYLVLSSLRLRTNVNAGRVMLIGAGASGKILLYEMKHSADTNDEVICFIDDDPDEWGRYIDNVPVVGGRETILENVKRYSITKIYFAIPSISNEDKREIIGSLLTSLTYVSADVWEEQLDQAKQHAGGSSARTKQIFDRFISLVNEHHNSQRNMAFYADELCLTPKYLSKLIKQASGRSAPEWIDAFVILEAKNMLKYSDMAIKEIVYKLHFANQSVFYKFFKAHTGLTPSEYRKG